jgi:hypothetical protein
LEDSAKTEDEAAQVGIISRQIGDHSLTGAQTDELWARAKQYRTRLEQRLATIRTERQAIEQRLPPSLVELTTRVEQAKRLKDSWASLQTAETNLAEANRNIARVARVKHFLDTAAETFAAAEAAAAQRRLTAVQPLCRTLFAAIIHDPVEPALIKPAGGEELRLSLARFWSLQDVSEPRWLCIRLPDRSSSTRSNKLAYKRMLQASPETSWRTTPPVRRKHSRHRPCWE